MANPKDYYDILGVNKASTADEIKRAYRKLALQFHPDRNKTKEADAKFKEVTKAYEVLSDPEKRKAYDQFGPAAFEQGGMGQGPFGGSQGGPFGGFGGSQGGQQSGRYGPFTYSYSTDGSQFDFGGFSDPFDIFEQFFGGASPFGRAARRPAYSLTITFQEAVTGVEKQVQINGKTQKIKIPPGVDIGSRIRFSDFDLVLDVLPDKRFDRQGADIISEKEISFSQATLGEDVSVETVQGDVKIRIPSGTQPDTHIRLRGKGMPLLRGTGHGDHYVRIKVAIPKTLTKRQKELLEEFEKESKSSTKGWF